MFAGREGLVQLSCRESEVLSQESSGECRRTRQENSGFYWTFCSLENGSNFTLTSGKHKLSFESTPSESAVKRRQLFEEKQQQSVFSFSRWPLLS